MGKFSSGCAAAGLAFGLTSMAAHAADVMPMPTLDGGIALANVTLSVSDLEKSTAFYKALGFEAGDTHQPPMSVAAKSLGIPPTYKLDVRFLIKNGQYVELVHLDPSPKTPASTGSAGQLGLSALDLRVDNVERVAAIIKQNGGKVLGETHVTVGQPGHTTEFLFCTDPDGTRIELVAIGK